MSPSRSSFMEMLRAQWDRDNFACVGLDSELKKIPAVCWRYHPGGTQVTLGLQREMDDASTIVAFNRAIVEATKDIVCAYKPNTAFYEACGAEGIVALHRTIADIHDIAPGVPVILDGKRADIGNTNASTAKFAFDYLKADAITINPYLGAGALHPFLDRKEKGVIVLCRTTNPGAGEFQDLEVRKRDHLLHLHPEDDRWEPMYLHVARRVADDWNKNSNCALVVGATYPAELGRVRKIVGDMPILIPGIGAQGGDVEKAVSAGKDSRGQGMIVNSSSGIIFASDDNDFAKVAGRKTRELRDLINQYR